MGKRYHAILATIGAITIGLAVPISPVLNNHGAGRYLEVSTAQAEDDSAEGVHNQEEESHQVTDEGSHHTYGADGYDEDGHDREGYDREGYREDGHRRDGSYDEGHDHSRDKHQGGTSGSAQPFVVKPKIKQY